MTGTDFSTPMIALDLGAVGYSLWILARSPATRNTMMTSAAVAVAWLALLHVGLSSRAVFPDSISGWLFLAIVFGFVGVVGALLLATPVRGALTNLTQADLLQLQGVRVYFGAGFVAMAAFGELPKTFGLIDGFTHITAGFLGLLAAQRVGCRSARGWIWAANLFGLADILIVASTLALFLLPTLTPHHAMMYAVFLPAPLWLWFHVVSLAKGTRRVP